MTETIEKILKEFLGAGNSLFTAKLEIIINGKASRIDKFKRLKNMSALQMVAIQGGDLATKWLKNIPLKKKFHKKRFLMKPKVVILFEDKMNSKRLKGELFQLTVTKS